MTYMVWDPEPPTVDLRLLGDRERKIFYGPSQIRRPLWDLEAIQAALQRAPALRVIFTEKAAFEMKTKLGWGKSDALQFLRCLTRGHYDCSEWCHAPKGNTPRQCDVYLMGFSKIQGVENPRLLPWVYIKFGFVGPEYQSLAVYSVHPEEYMR